MDHRSPGSDAPLMRLAVNIRGLSLNALWKIHFLVQRINMHRFICVVHDHGEKEKTKARGQSYSIGTVFFFLLH